MKYLLGLLLTTGVAQGSCFLNIVPDIQDVNPVSIEMKNTKHCHDRLVDLVRRHQTTYISCDVNPLPDAIVAYRRGKPMTEGTK